MHLIYLGDAVVALLKLEDKVKHSWLKAERRGRPRRPLQVDESKNQTQLSRENHNSRGYIILSE